jgi:small subunit ribosomal protein S8
MVIIDPIADMLTRLKNAAAVGHATVTLPFSNFRLAVAEVLERAGYLKKVVKKGKKIKKFLELELAYDPTGRTKFAQVRRVSKPSRRVYRRAAAIRPVRQGFGLSLYSTVRGVLTGEEAKKEKIGGEFLAEI